MAQLQRRADQGRQHRGHRQLPGRHLGHRLHQSGAAEGDRLRRPGRRSRRPRGRLPRRRLVDLLAQRQALRVRHPPRPDHLGPRQRVHQARPHVRDSRTRRRRSASYEADNVAPTVDDRAPLEGAQLPAGLAAQSPTTAAPTPASGVESCVGNVADGAAIDTSKIGYHTFTVTATDNAGNKTTKSVQYMVNSTAIEGSAGRLRRGHAVAGLGTPARSARSRRASRGSTRRPRPPT